MHDIYQTSLTMCKNTLWAFFVLVSLKRPSDFKGTLTVNILESSY